MANFLYLYTGGNPPKDAAEGEKVMQNWMAYFGRMGPKIVDGGAPLGDRKAVAGAPASGASGYSIISADSLEEAVAMTENHPHLASGGAIEVIQTVPIGM
jgi:hypothetical protein